MERGIINKGGTVIGTYLHGFLDKDLFRNKFLSYIRSRKYKPRPQEIFNFEEFRTRDLNKLTDLIKTSINMEAIKKNLH